MTQLTRAEFFGQPLDIIDHAGKRWLTAEQIGLALGYNAANARQGINNLYNRHPEDFTEADTCVINLMTQGQRREVRVFSDTGCVTLGWLANTERARQFKQWAKQVLAEKLRAPAPATPTRNASGRLLVTRELERQVLELFVQGQRQKQIAQTLGISLATVNLLVHAKYQFSPAAGSPQSGPELLAAVAAQHLACEQARLIEQQQRLTQRFCSTANNQQLAEQLDRVGRHLQQAPALALLPLAGGEQ